MKKLIGLLALALFSNQALAADNTKYMGLDYTWGLYDHENGIRLYLDGPRIRYGQYLTPHIAFEIHYIYGTSGDNLVLGTNAFGQGFLEHTGSIFLRGDIGDTFKLYGLFGYSDSHFTLAGNTQIERDLSYGGGFEYQVTKQTSIDLSYVIYHDEKYLTFSSSGIGLTHRF